MATVKMATTLIIGQDIIQCEKCKIWYQVSLEHICKVKDLEAAGFDFYALPNLKTPAEFRRIRSSVQSDVDNILARVEKLKNSTHGD